jgi:hypothetical protein
VIGESRFEKGGEDEQFIDLLDPWDGKLVLISPSVFAGYFFYGIIAFVV